MTSRFSRRRREREPGWALAKQAFALAFESLHGPNDDSVGYVRRLGSGLSRDAYSVAVEGRDSNPDAYVALVPNRDADPGSADRSRREASLLTELARLDLPFRLPRHAHAVVVSGQVVLVREALRGIAMEALDCRRLPVPPWQIVANLARAVHAIDPTRITTTLPGYETRRAHALAHLRELEGLDAKEVVEARAWALEHLPPDTPATLLHGDLLAQNILLDFANEPPGLIDWEYAMRGDPAYDLAIVTRGSRRPFKNDRGFDLLVNAYNETGAPVLPREARLHELCLLAAWYRESLTAPGPESPEALLARMRRILRQAESAGS